ncbi:MAG: alpha/beta hydrolase [Chloroflexota bacterium]|nr:alpha/beta hydrolase [Chloroflexota bacterium]MDQ5864879.1 alpha/beta hydrolase [Chloroflexota bacterium]
MRRKRPRLRQVRTANTRVELSYRDWGGDGPPMLLLHGLGSTHHIWDLAAPLLSERFHVVAYDQRGHGFSEKPGTGYDLDTMLADLRGLVEALGLGRVFVVGHSWGGSIALAYAGCYADECAGIALVDGGLVRIQDIPGIDTWETMSELMAPTDLSPFKLADLVKKTRNRGLDALPRHFIAKFLRATIEEQTTGALANRLSRDNHMLILRTIWDTRPEDLLNSVRCPALIVTALPEAKTPQQEAYNAAKLLGVARAERYLIGYKSVIMPDTLHDVPLHRPAELAKQIMDYFAPGDSRTSMVVE